ncbi:MAG: DUF2934 domain-containing protein [Candidatus Acidiferrales bacterium]
MSPRQKSSSAGGKAPRSTSHPTHEEIELHAYQKYVERGGGHGRDVEDWLKAERELLKKYKKSRARATSGKVR